MAKFDGAQIAIVIAIIAVLVTVGFIGVNNYMIANTDTDGDGVIDIHDAFPYDPFEWADTDGDGVGDNYDPDPNDPNISDINITMVVTIIVYVDEDGISVSFNGLVYSVSKPLDNYIAGHVMDSWEINFAREVMPGYFEDYDVNEEEWIDTNNQGNWHVYEYSGPGGETRAFEIKVPNMIGHILYVDVKAFDVTDVKFLHYGYNVIIGKSGE